MAMGLTLHLTSLPPHLILHIFTLVHFWLWPKCWMEQLNMLQGVLEPLPPLHLHLGVPQVQNHRSNAQIVNGMDMRLQPQCCSPLSSQNPLLICQVQKPLQSLPLLLPSLLLELQLVSTGLPFE